VPGEVEMPIKVSVVVPVYNPGQHIAESVESLLAQTMPADELELIFVDDGSTDDTPALLDRLAEEHEQIRVFHEPPSGWPGRPRNVGLEAAVGEYVQFVDQDDRLGDEALTRLYAMARRNDSDIVIGKMIGINRNVPVLLFGKSWENATIHNSPIIDSLTPHKMFRREFLLESGLRFPEGPRRLEDHVFVVAAYFAAQRISVLSDYACYFHISRGDHGNAGYRPHEALSYLGYVGEVLDIVDKFTEPGPARDRLHRRWMRIEILGRLRGARFLKEAPAYREEFVREARSLVNDRFAPGVDAGLSPLERVVAGLLRTAGLSALLQLAEWENDLKVSARLRGSVWRDGALVLDVAATIVDGEGKPVQLSEHDGSPVLVPPVPADVLEALPPNAMDVSGGTVSLDLFARHTGTKVQRFLPGSISARSGQSLTTTTLSRLPVFTDPGEPEHIPDGVWEIHARWRAFGWTFSRPVTPQARTPGDHDPVGPPAVMGATRRLATPHRSPRGNLSVELATGPKAVSTIDPKIHADRRLSMTKARPRATVLDLILHFATDRSREVQVVLAKSDQEDGQLTPALLVPLLQADGTAACRLTATITRKGLAPGQCTLRVLVEEVDGGLPIRNKVTVTRRRSVRLEGVPIATVHRILGLISPNVYHRIATLRRRAIAIKSGRAS
jgi:glycosyltransferase involved in cell wall biosynthesis